MDNTPNYTNPSVEQKPSRKKTIWLVLIILALIASNTGWVLFYLKQQGEMTAKINTLTAQNLKLAKDNKDLQNADSKTDDTADYREIPELGVKYKITNDNKDLTYKYSLSSEGKLESVAISFKSVFSEPIEDSSNSYETFPYTAVVMKYSKNQLGNFNIMGETDINAYKKESPQYVKKVGDDTYVIVVPDGGGLNPRAKAAIAKQKTLESTLQSFTAL